MTVMWLIGGILAVVSLSGIVYWGVVLVRIRRALTRFPNVEAGLELPEPETGWPSVSIIVPAHNEQDCIERSVAGLRSQTYPDLEIIYVLDRCSDGTARLLRPHAEQDPRITIIENDSCPSDWAGKCNAARIGVEAARGKYLLFTDADVRFGPEVTRAAVALLLHREGDLLTLLSTLSSQGYHGVVAEPVAAFTLLQMNPMERSDPTRTPRSFANGQFMLFPRGSYERLGGHEAVKQDLCEDLALARLLRKLGGRPVIVRAGDLMHCSMYDSMADFAKGWNRIFITVCKTRPRAARRHGWRVLAGVLLTPMELSGLAVAAWMIVQGHLLLGLPLLVIALAGLIVQTAALAFLYPLSGAPWWAIALYPLGCWEVGAHPLQSGAEPRSARAHRMGWAPVSA